MLPMSAADHLFVLTGAGVSTESGIPTFRGVGDWRNYRIEEVASPEAWHRDPRLVWDFYSMRRRLASAAISPTETTKLVVRSEGTLAFRAAHFQHPRLIATVSGNGQVVIPKLLKFHRLQSSAAQE